MFFTKSSPLFLLLIFASMLHAQSVVLHPLQQSIGVAVHLPAGYDPDKTAKCFFKYKKNGETTWREGFPADRISVSGIDQFRGSIFLLPENTNYDVQVTLLDSIPSITSQTLAVATTKTQTAPQFNQTNNVKWVSPSGSGTAYTQANPGNVKTLLASGAVTCGTTVMLMDGTYTQLGLILQLTTDCTANTPIQFLAAPNAKPVFDGGHSAALTWAANASDSKLYSATLPSGADYTNLCLLNGKALYTYPTLSANILFGNYNLAALSFGYDGFIRDKNSISIKTSTGINPNNATVTLSKAFRFMTIYGNGKNAFLKFQGIAIKHVAKSNVSGGVAYEGKAFDIRNTHHITFDKCQFIYNNSNIEFIDQCNNILIQNCEFKHNNGSFTHAMVKKSHFSSAFFPTSLGRNSEQGSGISFFTNQYITIRNNIFQGIGSGIIGNFDSGLIEEVEIFDNYFADNFDAIECDGSWCNLRIWKNEIAQPMAAFSIAPPLVGPRYFYRNLIYGGKGRRNEKDDPYFSGCQAPTEYVSASVGIKTNSGYAGAGLSGNIYFINNTFYSNDPLGFSFTLWDSEWRKIYFYNNIFADQQKHLGYFHSLLNKPSFQYFSSNDNYFSYNSSAPILVAKEIHGEYVCRDILNINEIQPKLRSISGSNQINIVNPLQQNPLFNNTVRGGFELQNNSPLINKGIRVAGFYDYLGSHPDLGAKEAQGATSSYNPVLEEGTKIFPNPTKAFFNINIPAQAVVEQIAICDAQGKTIYTQGGFIGQTKVNFAASAKGVYWVVLQFKGGYTVSKRVIY